MIENQVLQEKVSQLLGVLYEKRMNNLRGLRLKTLLGKNPYLYRALGLNKPTDFIESLLRARLSSSDETIFGNDFFEPLAIFVAQEAQRNSSSPASVTVGAGAGQDIAIETMDAYLAISVKSGTKIFNSQSTKGQTAEFSQLQARLKKIGKTFRPIIGYGYGRSSQRTPSAVEKLAGQKFWKMLTGEEDFYLRISRVMEQVAKTHASEFDVAYTEKHTALLKEFLDHFMTPSGSINWDGVVAFNSSASPPIRLSS